MISKITLQNSGCVFRICMYFVLSNFGSVIKRRVTTPCDNFIKQILYPSNPETLALQFGKSKESIAISKFTKEHDIPVSPAGLFVDTEQGFLAASPDGLIGNDGLTEVKCLYKLNKLGISVSQAIKNDKTLCLHLDQDGQIKLKRKHNYYYQIHTYKGKLL